MVIAATDTGSGRDTNDRDWSRRTGIGPVSEFSVVVVSPTFDAPTTKQRTRMTETAADAGFGRDTRAGF